MYFSRIRIQPEIYKSTQFAKVLSDNTYSKHRLLWDLFPGQEKRNFVYREEIAREQLGTRAGVRGEPVYYLVSATEPLSKSPFFNIETREYQPKLKNGDRLSFELRANPVITKNGKKHDIVMDAQRRFLKTLCTELNIQSYLSSGSEKKEFKKALLDHGGRPLDKRLTTFLEEDYRYAERLNQSMTLPDKLEWSIKAEINNALDNWMLKRGENNAFVILKDNHGQLKLQNSAYQWHELTKKTFKGKKSGFSSVDYAGDLEITDVDIFKKALFEGIGRSKAFGCGLMLVRRA